MENKDLEHELTNERLHFIAKILSLYTHEIKNHMAIINESVGLMGDIIEFSGESSEIDSVQILELGQKTKSQIKASSQFTSFLNHFGHRMDTEHTLFGVNDALEELVTLLHKAAVQNRVILETEFEPTLKPVFTNPSLFQFLIFLFLYKTITAIKPNSVIKIKTKYSVNDVSVTILPLDVACIDNVLIDFILSQTGYKIQWLEQSVEILIPRHISTKEA
ncbi:MAG: hypothetical protein HQK88_00100 [Nitrospirae bacterium]|nr:hypothetical protein [Nitrospirota bacterium]MBF0535183.1 hypothetical protein [Nitrospirota bacterium]MBF0615198.1 hypothetical protein [Nitrospirota bacterium]